MNIAKWNTLVICVGFTTTVKNDLQTYMKTMHEVQCGICKTKFKNLYDLNVHEKEDHSEEEVTNDESSVVQHLRKKCEYMEEEIVKERKINAANIELVNNQKKY
jgi:predicted metal-binding protein